MESAPQESEPALPSRRLPAAILAAQGLVSGVGLLLCTVALPRSRYAVGTFAAVVEVAFAFAILASARRPQRQEAIRTFAIRYVILVAVGALLGSSFVHASEVTGFHLVWSFALLGILLGEPTKVRVGLCASVLVLFDVLLFVGLARRAFAG